MGGDFGEQKREALVDFLQVVDAHHPLLIHHAFICILVACALRAHVRVGGSMAFILQSSRVFIALSVAPV